MLWIWKRPHTYLTNVKYLGGFIATIHVMDLEGTILTIYVNHMAATIDRNVTDLERIINITDAKDLGATIYTYVRDMEGARDIILSIWKGLHILKIWNGS